MMLDELESTFGTAILSELTGQSLTRNRQAVLLFDQTRHSSEYFFRSDEQGKPYIQNFAEGKRYYPVTAYCEIHQVDYTTAMMELTQQYGSDGHRKRNQLLSLPKPAPSRVSLTVPIDYLPFEVYQRSQNQPKRNGFYRYLCRLFDESIAIELFTRYRLGTSRHWQYEGALSTCLPQFDTAGNLHQVKVIPFHPLTGYRAKAYQAVQRWNDHRKHYEPDEGEKVWFAGKALAGRNDLNLQQCYFGEHLLVVHPEKRVALVEGESTAVVCSALWPDYVWLATGGSTGGKWYDPERFEALRNRHVVLWPDSGKYKDWSERASPLRDLTASLCISRYIEDNKPLGTENIDLRDLLTWPRYTPKGGKPIFGEKLVVDPVDSYPPNWDTSGPSTALTLVPSPNRDEFAQRLHVSVEELPLYRLTRA